MVSFIAILIGTILAFTTKALEFVLTRKDSKKKEPEKLPWNWCLFGIAILSLAVGLWQNLAETRNSEKRSKEQARFGKEQSEQITGLRNETTEEKSKIDEEGRKIQEEGTTIQQQANTIQEQATKIQGMMEKLNQVHLSISNLVADIQNRAADTNNVEPPVAIVNIAATNSQKLVTCCDEYNSLLSELKDFAHDLEMSQDSPIGTDGTNLWMRIASLPPPSKIMPPSQNAGQTNAPPPGQSAPPAQNTNTTNAPAPPTQLRVVPLQ